MTHHRNIPTFKPKRLSTYLTEFDNILLPEDFNMTPGIKNLQHFTDSFNPENT